MNYGIKDYQPMTQTLTMPEFKPVQFIPQYGEYKSDIGNTFLELGRTMDVNNKEALDEYNKTKDAISQIRRDGIHADADSYKVFDDKINEYEQELNNIVQANYGSYHKAFSAVKELARNFNDDKTIAGLIQNRVAKDEKDKEIDAMFTSKRIDDITRRRLHSQLEENYKNDYLYDKDNPNKIIGVQEFNPRIEIVDKFKPEEIVGLINTLTAPIKRTTGGTTTRTVGITNSGKITDNIDLGTGTQKLGTSSSGGTHTLEELSPEMLEETYNAIKILHHDWDVQMDSYIEDLKFELKDLTKRLNEGSIDLDNVDRDTNRKKELELMLKGKGAGGGGMADPETLKKALIQTIYRTSYRNTSDISNSSLTFDGGTTSNGESFGDTLNNVSNTLNSLGTFQTNNIGLRASSSFGLKPNKNLLIGFNSKDFTGTFTIKQIK